MGRDKKNNLLEGPITGLILRISIPIIFANVLQTIYQLIDTFWVGRIGTDAVAAVSLSFPILFFATSLALGFAVAGSVLIAQYNGRNDKRNISIVTSQTFSFMSVLAIILTIIGFFSAHFILSFLTKDFVVLSQATSYLRISFLALLGMFIYNVFQASLRGVGEVKLPMIIISITVVLNFFLDPLFMFGWKFIPSMGIPGVAIATLITEYLSAIIGIIILLRGKHGVKINIKDIIPKKKWFIKIHNLGFPTSIENSSRAFGLFVMTFIVSLFGNLIIAAYGIGTRILSFIIIPAIGFSFAATTLVGNNMGAKKYKRAEKIAKSSILIGFLTLEALGIIMFFFSKQVAGFFVPGNLELIAESATFIKIMALAFGFVGIQMAVIGTLRAAGKTTSAMVLALLQAIPLLILSLILSRTFNMGALGIWIAFPASNVIALFTSLYFYWKKSWLRKDILEEKPHVKHDLTGMVETNGD